MTTKSSFPEPPIARMTPMVISSIVIPIAAILLYLPYTFHIDLFHSSRGVKSASAYLTDLNLDSCSAVSTPPEMGWCAEPVVEKSSGVAYFVCDDMRPWWDPVRMIWQDAPPGKQGGSLWAWDLKDETSQPEQLELSSLMDAIEIFHPLSISVVSAPTTDGSSSHANILLISNHPTAASPGFVDVYRHPIDGQGLIAHAVFYDRIGGKALDDQSPYKVEAVSQQWGLPISPAIQGAGPDINVPSFLFTAVPSPATPSRGLAKKLRANGTPLSRRPTIVEYLTDVFLPTRQNPPKDVFYHLSTAYSAKSLLQTTSAYPHHPPLIRAWDGGGALGGSNSSTHNLFVTATAAKNSLLEQWDEHWVRGLMFGVEITTNKRLWKEVQVRWPSFITIWNKPFDRVLRGLALDSLGRQWTISSADEGLSEKLVETLRSGNETALIQPGALIHQTTFIHRVGAAVAHPWEVERIGKAKKRGIWLPKEFITSLIYRQGLEHVGIQGEEGVGEKEGGFLPKAPTGIAVDEARKRIIVTSSWDQGIAVCAFKEGWVEM